jgi:hypothetical protein
MEDNGMWESVGGGSSLGSDSKGKVSIGKWKFPFSTASIPRGLFPYWRIHFANVLVWREATNHVLGMHYQGLNTLLAAVQAASTSSDVMLLLDNSNINILSRNNKK